MAFTLHLAIVYNLWLLIIVLTQDAGTRNDRGGQNGQNSYVCLLSENRSELLVGHQSACPVTYTRRLDWEHLLPS